MKKRMAGWLLLPLVMTLSLFQSCDKDDSEPFSFTLSDEAAFVTTTGGSASVGFSGENLQSVTATSYPDGWHVVVDNTQRTVTVFAPSDLSPAASDDVESVSSGYVSLTGRSFGGNSLVVKLYVALVRQVDYSAEPANSYLLNKSNTRYTFDATACGGRSGSIQPASVGLVWQSIEGMVEYLTYEEGRVSFFFPTDTKLEDGDFLSGNALLGAYDEQGKLLWTWHLWATMFDPEEDGKGSVELTNGVRIMTRNLGAFDASGKTTADVLESYGMYYQWGRKEPFIGPAKYNVSTDALLFNADEQLIYFTYTASTDGEAAATYALTHPMTYLTGLEANGYDWLPTADDSRWGAAKTENDPCPYGWKVPSADDLAVLSMKEAPTADMENTYGYVLTDGTQELFFPGAGRRSFYRGDITNMNDNELRPTPWIGYYWTTTPSGRSATALHFSYDKEDLDKSAQSLARSAEYRAGGFQVRCVRDEAAM